MTTITFELETLIGAVLILGMMLFMFSFCVFACTGRGPIGWLLESAYNG